MSIEILERVKELKAMEGSKNIPLAKQIKRRLREEILRLMGDNWTKEVGDWVLVKQKHSNKSFKGFCVAIYEKEAYENYKKYNRGESLNAYQQDLEMIKNLK